MTVGRKNVRFSQIESGERRKGRLEREPKVEVEGRGSLRREARVSIELGEEERGEEEGTSHLSRWEGH